ncbi:EAL domain-containing protein [Niveispirillum sp. SYP-B3756]|uniref:putative bifunctional diguanylate cyclase/phosphodiesterase n=1 Tax=Niveispirillum sp. SYP-B3756 TaxID=2662178 RepID=UPI001290C396|nr:GGDEF domain-containing response regulator [Niveispirillum sp. SYP-B3756]MQP65115.1 EAL domain-containing protein [Niveispirillum sp. SYP-B3756]
MTGHSPVRLLLVEDNELDAAWLIDNLRRGGLDIAVTHVDNRMDIAVALSRQAWDIVLCDYSMPSLSPVDVIAMIHGHDPDLPLIVVTGTIGEESAVALMQAGAADLVLKERIARLRPAIERELAASATRRRTYIIEAARRQADNLLRAIAANIPGMIFRRYMSVEGTVTYTFMQKDILADFIDTGGLVDPTNQMLVTASGAAMLRSIHPHDRQRYRDAMHRSATCLEPMTVEFQLITPSSPTKWLRSQSQPERLADGSIQWDGIALDVTELKAAESVRDHLAYFDPVTGLPNRTQLTRLLTDALASTPEGQRVALFCLSLESFTDLQDGWGLAATDTLLRQVAERLGRLSLPQEVLARLESGYFCFLLPNAPADLTPRLRELQGAFDTPYTVDGVQLRRRALVGVSLYPTDASDPLEMLQHASTALHQVKTGGVPFRLYVPEMTQRVLERQWLQSELSVALGQGDITLFFQPMVHPVDYRIIGAEALVRWHHRSRGLISPVDFVPAAEQGGQIVELGYEVLRIALKQAAAWRAAGLCDFPLSVNVSGIQLMRPDFSTLVLDLLNQHSLPAAALKLELTESTIIRDEEVVLRNITDLAERGVSFSLDDFGMEHSVFSRLSELPIDTVKVDKFFISQMTQNDAQAALVQAIVVMAHAMRKQVVAEGVETQEELIYLRAYQCDALQGYLFSRPVPAAEMEALLQQRHLGRASP